jgi:hypothetical protein
MRRVRGVVLFAFLAACGGQEAPAPEPMPSLPAGCAIGTITTEAGCQAPGVPNCAEGFDVVDGGCAPQLPEAACGDGTMAIPGDATCRPPSPCGEGPWGEAPIEAGAVFVDASAAPAGDGSEAAPFTTIQQGVDAAAAGAQVRIAGGDYVEDVSVSGKPVELIGRCADMVHVSDANGPVTTVLVWSGASGSVVSGMRITGSNRALGVTGSTDVVFSGLALHDTSNTALLVQDAQGPTSAILRDSVIYRAGGAAALIEGATLVMERCEIRDGIVNANGTGRGPSVQAGGELVMSQSVIRGSHDIALHLSSSTATVSASAFIDNFGRALNAQLGPDGTPSSLTVHSSVIDSAVGVSVFASGSAIAMHDSVVKDTIPQDVLAAGWSVVAQNAGPGAPAALTLDRVLIDGYDAGAVSASGASVAIDGLWVRGAATSSTFGRGVNVQLDPGNGTGASLSLVNSWVDDAFDAGVMLNGADGALSNVQIARPRPRPSDGAFGDGLVAAATNLGPMSVSLDRVTVTDAARAGIAAFAAEIGLTDSTLECNPIDINGEHSDVGDFVVEDRGGNTCGCGGEASPDCKVLSTGLSPPDPLPGL